MRKQRDKEDGRRKQNSNSSSRLEKQYQMLQYHSCCQSLRVLPVLNLVAHRVIQIKVAK